MISFFMKMATAVNDYDYDTYSEVPPQFFKIIFLVFGIVGFLMLLFGILLIISGFFIKKRSNRIFSFIIAILGMLSIPWGTILGIMTVIVLSRESVKKQYELSGEHPPVLTWPRKRVNRANRFLIYIKIIDLIVADSNYKLFLSQTLFLTAHLIFNIWREG